MEAVRGDGPPTLSRQMSQFAGPLASQVEASGLLESVEWPARNHSQTERRSLSRALESRQFLARLDGALSLLELFAIQLRVGPILRSNPAHIAGGAGTQSVKRSPAPVINVVSAGE